MRRRPTATASPSPSSQTARAPVSATSRITPDPPLIRTLAFACLATITAAVAYAPSSAAAPADQPPPPPQHDPAAPTAAQLLDRYDRSIAALRNARIHFSLREETAYSWKPSQWKLEDNSLERDARGRMKFVWRRMFTPQPQDRLDPDETSTMTFLWDGAHYHCLKVDPPGYLARMRAQGKQPVDARNRVGRDLVIAAGPLHRDNAYAMATFDPLNGVFAGDSRAGEIKTVSQILRASAATVAERREPVGGVMCYVLEAKAPSGRYTVWLDPDHGYHIAAAECRRTGDDLYAGRPLSRMRTADAVRLPADLPRGPWLEHRFSLRDVKFRQVDGQWVPVRADYLSEEHYNEDGKRAAIMGTVERTSVELGVNFDAAGTFKPDFPDDTPVTTFSDNDLVANFRRDLWWRAGRVVQQPPDPPQ